MDCPSERMLQSAAPRRWRTARTIGAEIRLRRMGQALRAWRSRGPALASVRPGDDWGLRLACVSNSAWTAEFHGCSGKVRPRSARGSRPAPGALAKMPRPPGSPALQVPTHLPAGSMVSKGIGRVSARRAPRQRRRPPRAADRRIAGEPRCRFVSVPPVEIWFFRLSRRSCCDAMSSARLGGAAVRARRQVCCRFSRPIPPVRRHPARSRRIHALQGRASGPGTIVA